MKSYIITVNGNKMVVPRKLHVKAISQEKYHREDGKMSITLSHRVAVDMALSRGKRTIYRLPNGALAVMK